MIKTYAQAIKDTLDEELMNDPNLFLFGEDIGVYGVCFGATKGLQEKYGNKRVIDSPMSEQAIAGLGIGAALNGLRPVIEIMFMDFITLIYDQILNHASIFSYLSNGEMKVPLVIRVPAGGGRGYGATHSKSLWSALMNIPGIKIIAPSNTREVSCLLRAAIKDNNPVIFVEHKSLYQIKDDVENAEDIIPIGKAKIVKEGNDLLLISFSKMVLDCLEVANKLENEGISIEVLDLRTVKPLDIETIKNSIDKIGKVIVVEEGFPQSGIAAEIIAQINEVCFYSLDGPIKRICTLEIPLPCSPKLENMAIPSKERIENEIRSMLNE